MGLKGCGKRSLRFQLLRRARSPSLAHFVVVSGRGLTLVTSPLCMCCGCSAGHVLTLCGCAQQHMRRGPPEQQH
eukprot:scaffold142861_cov21-Tisochrysis_lutea.AAC.2